MKAALGVVKHGFDLLSRDAGKPGEELIDARAAFEILKKGFHRYPGSSKYPGATDYPSVTFHGGARGPVQHGYEVNLILNVGQALILYPFPIPLSVT